MNEFLEKAEEFLSEGRDLKAREIILRHRLRPGQTAEEYFRWGSLCEALGLKAQAAECYDLAISRDPDNSRYLMARAEVAYEMEDLPRAATLFYRVLRLADSQTVRRKLAQVLRELGRPGAAAAVAGPLEAGFQETPLRYFPPNLGDRELEPLRTLFRGRPLHAEMQITVYGRTALVIRDGAPTSEKLSRHLLGRTYLVYFPLTEDNRLHSAYFVIALPEREVDRNRRNRGWLAIKAEAVKKEALSVWHRARAWGLEGALERVNPFRYRLWFFFSEPVYFLWVRRFFETLKERLPFPGEGIFYSYEIGTRGEGVGWLEKGFELPLGIHPATLERSLFVDSEGVPHPEQLSFLKRIRPISPGAVREFCRRSTPVILPEGDPPELKRLRRSCAIVDLVIRRAEAGRRLSREEKLTVMLSVGFLRNGRELVHRILSGTPDYSYTRLERMFRGIPRNPISCIKLESWFRDFVMDTPCGCVFGRILRGRYPSPLLHVDPHLVPGRTDRLTLAYSSPAELAGIYLHTRERLCHLEDELREYLRRHSGRLRAGDYFVFLEGDRVAVRRRKGRTPSPDGDDVF